MDIDSPTIQQIRYDKARQKLFIRFAGGDEYLYVGVPGEVHRSFMSAPSRGGFFARQIRDRYPYNRLDA